MIFSMWTLVLLENLVYSIKLPSDMKVISSFTFQGVDAIEAYIPDAVWYEYDTVGKCRGCYGEIF